jgi:hypothetical protein
MTGRDVEEGGVDEHQRRKRKRQHRPGGEIGGNDAEDDDQRIDDVKVAPLDRQLERRACPVAPVELVLLEDVNAVAGRCQPKEIA